MSHPADDSPQPVMTSPVIEMFPVAIGHFDDPDLPRLDVDSQVGRLVDLFAPFGGVHCQWAAPERERDASAVERRLEEWVSADSEAVHGSVLYWVGHGRADGIHAALAHKESRAWGGGPGVTPEKLADVIRRRQARPGCSSWALVVVDACRSRKFAQLLGALLESDDQVQDVILVGVSGEGATTLGRFTDSLRAVLQSTYPANQRIDLSDMTKQLKRLLPGCKIVEIDVSDAELVRVHPPVASWMSAPYDTVRYLEDVLVDLSPDERRHFLVKAQGAEYGELSWFFEGRVAELTEIAAWLRTAGKGMLIVCGRAGSGKSALLGNVMVHSLPDLRDAMARRGLITVLLPADTPPDRVFDAVIHLSGLTLQQISARIAAAAELGVPPSHTDPALGIATDLDWLSDQLAEVTGPAAVANGRPFTVLADALDESTDPLDTARSLLARIAAIPGIRVVVGTRISIRESFDAPPPDTNLLDALATAPPPSSPASGSAGAEVAAGAGNTLVWVSRDTAAISSYARRRLWAAKRFGRHGKSIPFMQDVSGADIDRVAAVIAGRDKEFLYARLAVYELIEDARLLTPGRTGSLNNLLDGDHQDLFGRALDRLANENDRYPILLRALALARGRGVPEADGIWATIVAALTTPFPLQSDADEQSAWVAAIGSLPVRAAAYIIVDTPTADAPSTGSAVSARRRPDDGTQPTGRDMTKAETGTVYRLAHSTFAEYFTTHDRFRDGARQDRIQAATALLDAATQAAGTDPASMPTYLVRHLSGHMADADLWDTLANEPGVLDCLDPDAVTTDALRTLFGRRSIPPSIAGVIGARDALTTARPADRAGLRQLATATHSVRQVIDEPTTSWGISAAHARSVTPHVRLTGHTASLNSVRSLNLPGRGTIIASASDDGTIRLWDPSTATPIGSPLTGHTSTVEDVAVFHHPNGRIMLASAGGEGAVRMWDVYSGRPVGDPMTGHRGRIFGICTLPGDPPDQPVRLATAGTDGMVRIWDPVAGQQLGSPLVGHQYWAWAVCAVPTGTGDAATGRTLLASCGADRTVRIWDLDTRQELGPPLTGHTSTVFSVCTLPGQGPGGRALLASAGADGTLRIWDPVTRQEVGEPINAYAGSLLTVCAFPGYDHGCHSDGRTLLATTGYDGTIMVWDPDTRKRVGLPLTSDAGPAWGICTLPSQDPDGPTLLATTGSDGTVRVWDPTASQPVGPATRYAGAARRVVMLPSQEPHDRPLLVTGGFNGTLRVWDPATGRAVDHPLTEKARATWAICLLPDHDPSGRTLLAGADEDGRVRLWDPDTGHQVGHTLGESRQAAWAVCALENHQRARRPNSSTLLAITGSDGIVQLWDPSSGRLAARLYTDDTKGVVAMCTLSGYTRDGRPNGRTFLATVSDNMMIRVWDPVTRAPVGEPLTGHTSDVQDICSFPWDGHPDGRTLLATVGFDGTLRLWDPVAGHQLGKSLIGHTASVLGVSALSATEPGAHTLLVTTGYDRTVRIWDPVAAREVGSPLTGHIGRVWSACVLSGFTQGSRQGRYPLMATTGDDGTVRIWDPNSGRAVGEPMTESPDTVNAIAGPGGCGADCLILAGDGSVHSWDGRAATLTAVDAPRRTTAAVSETDGDRSILLAGDAGGLVHLIDLGSGRPLRSPIQVDDGAVLALCTLGAAQAASVAVAGRSGDVVLLTPQHTRGFTGLHTLRRLAGHAGPVRDLRLLRTDAQPFLASAGDDGAVRLWDIHTGAPHGVSLTGHDGLIWSLATVPCQDRPVDASLASAGADGSIRLWDPLTGRQINGPLIGHTDQVRAVTCATTADGRPLLVSGGFDGTIRLWDCATGATVHTIPVGVPVHALCQQQPDERSGTRTGHGATLTVGLRTGILVLDLHASLFP